MSVVVDSLARPNLLETVFIGSSLIICKVALVCLRECKEISGKSVSLMNLRNWLVRVSGRRNVPPSCMNNHPVPAIMAPLPAFAALAMPCESLKGTSWAGIFLLSCGKRVILVHQKITLYSLKKVMFD